MSIDIQAHAYNDDPIAHAYTLQSGTVLSAAANPVAVLPSFTSVAQHFGCGFTSSSNGTDELSCMKAIPFKHISDFVGQYGDSGATPTISFLPQTDEHIIFSDYASRNKHGKVARVPTIISATALEAVPYIPNAYPQDTILTLTVAGIVCPAFNTTVEPTLLKFPVYCYQYAGIFPNLNHLNWTGTYHGEDIPMNFGTYNVVTTSGNATQIQIDTSRAMQGHILASGIDPYPGHLSLVRKDLSLVWREVGIIRFGADGKVAQYLNRVEVDMVCKGLRPYDAFP